MFLSELADKLAAQLIGDGQTVVTGVNTIQDAGAQELCFLSSDKRAKLLSESCAAAVLVDKPLDDCRMAQLVVDNVNSRLIQVLKLFSPRLTGFEGIHPKAVVDPSAKVDAAAAVGPNTYVGPGAAIGPHTTIGPGCSIGENTVIGAHCRLDSNVVVYDHCVIGNFCVIQANSTIGAVGFGYVQIDGKHQLIPHNGGVILEDEVEIGSNTCIDRAKFGNTVIGAGTKIDNLVQVAHNVQIGKNCLLAGHVGIAGSCRIGNNVIFAGQSGSSDHKTIGDDAILGARSVAFNDIEAGKTVWGFWGQDMRNELKCQAIYQNLPELAKTVKKLSRKLNIESKDD